MKTRRVASLLVRVGVVAAVTLFLAHGVRWSDLWASLAGADLGLLALVLALNAVMMTVKAARLRLLLRPGEASTGVCFLALLTSSALNNVTPLRGGDVARLWMLERRAGVTKAAAVAVTVVEKTMEILVLAALATAAALAGRGQAWSRVAAPIVLAAAGGALLLVGAAGRARSSGLDAGAGVGAGVGGRARAWLARWHERLSPGTKALRRPSLAGASLALSVLAWLCETTMVWMCARALGIPLDPALALTALLGVNLAIALPSAPASAGPFEGAMVVVLVLAGVAKGPALAFALLYHALLVVPVTIAGLAVVSRIGITLGERLPAARAAAE